MLCIMIKANSFIKNKWGRIFSKKKVILGCEIEIERLEKRSEIKEDSFEASEPAEDSLSSITRFSNIGRNDKIDSLMLGLDNKKADNGSNNWLNRSCE